MKRSDLHSRGLIDNPELRRLRGEQARADQRGMRTGQLISLLTDRSGFRVPPEPYRTMFPATVEGEREYRRRLLAYNQAVREREEHLDPSDILSARAERRRLAELAEEDKTLKGRRAKEAREAKKERLEKAWKEMTKVSRELAEKDEKLFKKYLAEVAEERALRTKPRRRREAIYEGKPGMLTGEFAVRSASKKFDRDEREREARERRLMGMEDERARDQFFGLPMADIEARGTESELATPRTVASGKYFGKGRLSPYDEEMAINQDIPIWMLSGSGKRKSSKFLGGSNDLKKQMRAVILQDIMERAQGSGLYGRTQMGGSKVGDFFRDFGRGFKQSIKTFGKPIRETLEFIPHPVAQASAMALKSIGAGKKKKYGGRKCFMGGSVFESGEYVGSPTNPEVQGNMALPFGYSRSMTGGKKPRKRKSNPKAKARGQMISKIMKEYGVSLGEASKMLSQMNKNK